MSATTYTVLSHANAVSAQPPSYWVAATFARSAKSMGQLSTETISGLPKALTQLLNSLIDLLISEISGSQP